MRPFHFLLRNLLPVIASLILLGITSLCATSAAEPPTHVPGGDGTTAELARQEYERLLEPYEDWTFEQLQQYLGLGTNEAQGLSFTWPPMSGRSTPTTNSPTPPSSD